ncbi:MAG: hypothetical protein WD232_08090 [Acidimicrobiales bacterium]
MDPLLAAAVLAHQGGWDEALFVAVPMTVLVGLLWLAQKRAADEERVVVHETDAHEPESAPEPDGASEPGPDGRR